MTSDSKPSTTPSEEITLNFRTGSPVQTQVCTECWCRKPKNQFGDTSDVCNDCLDL